MKKKLLLPILGLAVVSALGQGYIWLDNYYSYGPLVTYGFGVPANGVSGAPGSGGLNSSWTAGLYYAVGTLSITDPAGTGIPNAALALGTGPGSTAQFASANVFGEAGYFSAAQGFNTGAPVGSTVTVELVVYDTAGGSYAAAGYRIHSAPFTMTTVSINSTTPSTVGDAMLAAGIVLSLNGCLGPYWEGFTAQPTNQTVNLGDNVAFAASAIACPGPFCQWYFNGVPIPGATDSSYQIANAQQTNAGNYFVVFSNPAWGTYTSGTGKLTVRVMPVITDPPQSQSNVVGSTVQFQVHAEGAPILRYQWFFNGTPIPGENTTNLLLTSLQVSNTGDYTVVVTNAYGAITSAPATLTVLASSPTLVLTPWSRTAAVGTFLDLVVGAVGALPLSYQWYFNGVPIAGATSPDLHFSGLQFSNSGDYAVVVTNAFGTVTSAPAILTVGPRPNPRRGTVVAWGSNSEGQSAVPAGLSNVTVIAAGGSQSLAIDSNGHVYAWGYNSVGQSTVPSGLTDVIAVSAGGYHSLALKSDGTVVAWGSDYNGQSTVPQGLHDVIAIAAGGQHSLALRSDGTVVAWGFNGYGSNWGITNVPPDLRGVTAIAAGALHNLALKYDGTVTAWGYGPASVSPSLGGVIAVAAGGDQSLALKSDGTVVAWGGNYYGQSTVPVGLSGVSAISAGSDFFNTLNSHSVALRTDGTVIEWGYATQGQGAVPAGLSDVIAIAAGAIHNLALVSQAPAILVEPNSQTVEVGSGVEFCAKAAGHPPLSYQWFVGGAQMITGATNHFLELQGVQPEQSGTYLLVVTNIAGAVTSAPALLNVIPLVERRPVPGINLMGDAGSTLILVYAESLGPAPNWSALDSVNLTGTRELYFDLTKPLPPQRFYRAWQTGTPSVVPSLTLPAVIPAITLTGNIGDQLRLDCINQFGPTDAWVTLDTVMLTNTSQLYFDVSAPGQPARLYRIVPGP